MSKPKTQAIPKHVGIILDGNRRWARAQGLPTLEGHKQGSEVFKEVSLAAFERGVKCLSAYVFSTENWARKEEEVGYLMKLVLKATEKYLNLFHEAGIKVLILGRREGLRADVLNAIKRTEEKTRANSKGILALCFNYGGHQEIADAVAKLIEQGVKAKDVTPELFAGNLYSPEVPPIDLLIRTSGEKRLSGYMLYRSSYAELFFSDKYWPDFRISDLEEAISEFQTRRRRYGK